jgi:hypothetical protein
LGLNQTAHGTYQAGALGILDEHGDFVFTTSAWSRYVSLFKLFWRYGLGLQSMNARVRFVLDRFATIYARALPRQSKTRTGWWCLSQFN